MEQETLRDKFAMAALTGLVPFTDERISLSEKLTQLSKFSFELADKMMKEREKYNKE